MTDEKILKMIHREIDGELTESERAELSDYLASHPEAKALQGDFIKIGFTLSEIEHEEPSPNLKKRVMNVIPSQRYAQQQKTFSQIFFPGRKFNVRHAYVFLFGLAIGFVATTVVFDGGDRLNPLQVSGSLTTTESPNALPLREFDLSRMNIAGHVAFRVTDAEITSQLKWLSTDDLTLQINFDPTHVRFQGMSDFKTADLQLDSQVGAIMLNAKSVDCTLSFLKSSESQTSIRLIVSKSNAILLDENVQIAAAAK
jgi:hypothetical protein